MLPEQIAEPAVTLAVGSGLTITESGITIGPTTINSSGSLSGTAGTITTFDSHGLSIDKKIRLSGANESVYNGEFVVTQVNSLTSVSVNIGVTTFVSAATGTIYILPEGFTSNGGVLTLENENLSGRQIYPYAGITTTLSAQISNTNTDQIQITNIQDLDICSYLPQGADENNSSSERRSINPCYLSERSGGCGQSVLVARPVPGLPTVL